MKSVVLTVRVLLGAWLLYNGISYWLPHMPSGFSPVAVGLLAALGKSGVMLLVKIVELAVGAMLVLDLYTPLALVIGFPVVLIVAYVCLILEWPTQRPMIGGFGTLGGQLFLMLAYLDSYRPMLKVKARPFSGT